MKAMNKLRQVEIFCEAQHIKMTPLRTEILTLLAQSEHPLSAYDILRALRIKHPNAEPPTVYRVLEFFQQKNFLHRVDSNNTYLLCVHPETQHNSQVLICKACDSAIEVDDESIFNAIKKLAQKFKFSFSNDLIEIRGVCKKCVSSCPTPNL
jgi:Fur family zinc uptake transcriptional regulator